MLSLLLLAQTALAGESHPTAWAGDFSTPAGVTTSTGYASAGDTYLCNTGTSYYAEETWYDFELLTGLGKFPKLEVDWSASVSTLNYRATVDLFIEYTLDGGSTWTTLLNQSYSGINSSSLGAVATASVPLPRVLPANIGDIEVFSSITITKHCSSGNWSYGGHLYIDEIRLYR